MRIKFNKKFLKYLEKQGLVIIDPLIILDKKISIESHFQLELPCVLNGKLLTHRNKIKMGAYSYINRDTYIDADTSIGRYCSIGHNVTIGANSHPLDRLSTSPYFYCENWYNGWNKDFKELEPFEANKPVNIGNDVLIGCNVVIMAGVTIGDGAVIGAGAIITKDVEPYAKVRNVNEVYGYRTRPEDIRDPVSPPYPTKVRNVVDQWWNYDQIELNNEYSITPLKPKTLNRTSLQKLYNKFRFNPLNWF